MAKNKQKFIDTKEPAIIPDHTKDNRPAKREQKRKVRVDEVEKTAQSKRHLILFSAAALAAALGVYLLRMDGMVGQFLDDAWYVLLAKSLATGQGYMLINSPTPGIMPLYPPGFPLLLSLAYRVSPQFPQNVWLLKSVSILAMFGIGVAAYYYFARLRALPQLLALGIAAGTVLCPGFVFLATSTVMSECVFTLLQLLTVIAVERCVNARRGGAWKYAVLGAGLASCVFLTRSMAITLIGAVMVYLLKERLVKMTLIFTAVVILFMAPWIIYTRLHPLTPEQRAEQNNNYIIRSYTEQFWDRVAGHTTSGRISVGDLPARVGNNLVEIATQSVGGIIVTPLFRGLNQGMGERPDAGRVLVSLLLTALALTGFILTLREKITLAEIALPFSLIVIVLWPFPPYRYILPFLPFLIFYVAAGVRGLHRLHRRGIQTAEVRSHWVTMGMVAWSIVLLNLYANFDYIGRKFADNPQQRPRWLRIFEENEALLQWAAQNLPAEGVIAAQNPALAHLYTNRKTTMLDDPAGNWELWGRLGVRYTMHNSPVPVTDLPAENQYRAIYRSRGGLNLKVIDLGPPSSRPPWGK